MTLVEALVALLVMSFGMMALVELISSLKRGAELARQRGEALHLAQADLATLRSFSVLTPTANLLAFSDIQSKTTSNVAVTNSNTSYTVQRTVKDVSDPSGALMAKDVAVAVTWNDRAGAPQLVQLDSLIARIDPAFSGALTIAPPVDFVRLPAERSPVIPTSAMDMGDGTSAFRPASGGSTAWVFNNLTGAISKVCLVDANILNQGLSLGALQSCTNVVSGYFLAGTVRFSYGAAANPTKPGSNAIPVGVSITLSSSGHPTPAYECFNDAGVSVNAVNYFCIVFGNSASPSIWSGRVTLAGLDVGNMAAQYRVCRYTADYDQDNSISNNEHPLDYTQVSASLARQNFLVVRGDVNCPTAPAVDPANGVFVDYSTKEVQPTPAT